MKRSITDLLLKEPDVPLTEVKLIHVICKGFTNPGNNDKVLLLCVSVPAEIMFSIKLKLYTKLLHIKISNDVCNDFLLIILLKEKKKK